MRLSKWTSTVTCLLLSLTICGIAMAKPDLVVQNLKVREVAKLTGENIEFDFRIANTGNTDAPAYRVVLMLMRANRHLISRQIYSNVALPVGGVDIMQKNVKLSPGVYRVAVYADRNNKVDEVSESNNLAEKSFSVMPKGSVASHSAASQAAAGASQGASAERARLVAQADLGIDNMSFSPISQPDVPAGQRHPTVGDWVTISTVIKNLGLSPSNAAYLQVSLTTPKGRTQSLGRTEIAPLQQNASTTVTRKFKAKFRGRYEVQANLVPKNPGTFSDKDAGNNAKTMPIAIYFPGDLYLCMRRVENVLTREKAAIEVTVKNAGPGPSEAASLTIGIQNKPDKTFSIKPLAAKESVTITRHVKFYRGGRTHKYWAKINVLGGSWEAFHNNNYLTGLIKTHGKYVLEPPNNMQCSR